MQLPQPLPRPLTFLLTQIAGGAIKIPLFQRGFVWRRAKSARLADSILKGFPIGAFILWTTNERLRTIREIGDLHLPPPQASDLYVQYIIDGQQRLTSLFAVFGGNPTEGTKIEEHERIYVDFEAGPDDDIVITDIKKKRKGTYTIVKNIYHADFQNLGLREEYREKFNLYKSRVTGYQCPTIEIQDAAIHEATEIFTRINVNNKPLSVFEMMAAKTFDEEQNFELADNTSALLEELSDRNYDTIPDIIILHTISMLIEKNAQKKTILGLKKQDVIDEWPKAKSAILMAVDYLRQGLHVPTSSLLPYKHLVVPFAYFFANHHRPPAGKMQDRLVDFFWRVSLSGRYSFALEGKMAQDIKAIDDIIAGKQPEYDYPVKPTRDLILRNGNFNIQRSFIKAILCLFAENTPKNFKNDADVNIRGDQLKRSNGQNYHHFFPKGNVAWRNDPRINHIGNITLVDEYLNKGEIRNKKPSEYMSAFAKENLRLDATMATHMIDLSEAGIWEDDYDKFLAYRCGIIAEKLANKLIRQGVDTLGQTPNADDHEDLETAQREQAATAGDE